MDAPASPSLPRALLLGGPAWHPFSGHFRQVVELARVSLHVAGSVATTAEPEVGWCAAMRIRVALQGAEGTERNGIVRSAWDIVSSIERSELGPTRGLDLALLLVACDARGTVLAGTGLQAVYRLVGDQAQSLLPADHPLFAVEGIPDRLPGLLTLTDDRGTFVGAARSGVVLPTRALGWPVACGVRGLP